MRAKPTLGSVAKEAGVSIPTVSQVIRGTGRISEKTREKVLKAVKKLHYVPDSRASAMRSGENREIGFVINQISNPFMAEAISGVSDMLEAHGYLTSVLDARDDIDRQGRHLESFIRGGRGGLLWLPALETPAATFDMLKAYNIPTVTFLRRTPNPSFDHVGIRNAEATHCATTHLIELGHTKIAYLGGDIMTDVRQDRIEGYCKALRDAGLGPPIVWDSEDKKGAGMVATQSLCQSHPEITGIVCNGDMVALGACLALQRAGLVPGEALSVVGFDDI